MKEKYIAGSDFMKQEPTDDQYFEFRELLECDRIDPLDYVNADIHMDYLKAMANTGHCIDELIKKDNPEIIKTLIENEYAEKHYEQWKDHPDMEIRYMLAAKGLFPEHFINDVEPDVKFETICQHPELIPKFPQVLDNIEYLPSVVNAVYKWMDFKPQIEQLVYNKAIEYKLKDIFELELKLKAENQQPTSLEKTMSLQQLYDSGNPLWAKNYTPQQIATLLEKQYLEDPNLMDDVWALDPKMPSWYIDLFLLDTDR